APRAGRWPRASCAPASNRKRPPGLAWLRRRRPAGALESWRAQVPCRLKSSPHRRVRSERAGPPVQHGDFAHGWRRFRRVSCSPCRSRTHPGPAAAVTLIPLTRAKGRKGFTIEGRAPTGPGQIPIASYDIVTPTYFQTMQVPLLEGRDFSWSDSPQTQPVVIVNEAMAKRYWAGEDPLGKRFHQAGPDDKFPWMTIIGVVSDVGAVVLTVTPELPR